MKDYIGQRYGRWLILDKDLEKVSGHPYVKAECDCGKIKSVRLSSMLKGESTSCGCLARELAAQRVTTHGFSKHETWQAYYDMHRRCYDDKRKDFCHYGGKGIRVDNSWAEGWEQGIGFLRFLKDMGPKPFEKAEIERYDNSKNYCKENCYWEQRRGQNNNKSVNRIIEHSGYSLTLTQWAHLIGIRPKIICDRVNKLGWDEHKAMTTPPKMKGKNPQGAAEFRGLEYALEFLKTGLGWDDDFSLAILKRVRFGEWGNYDSPI